MEDGALDVSGIDSGRWGEVEIEKGPVDLFPTEPTDEATPWRGDLEPWVQGTPLFFRIKLRNLRHSDFLRKSSFSQLSPHKNKRDQELAC